MPQYIYFEDITFTDNNDVTAPIFFEVDNFTSTLILPNPLKRYEAPDVLLSNEEHEELAYEQLLEEITSKIQPNSSSQQGNEEQIIYALEQKFHQAEQKAISNTSNHPDIQFEQPEVIVNAVSLAFSNCSLPDLIDYKLPLTLDTIFPTDDSSQRGDTMYWLTDKPIKDLKSKQFRRQQRVITPKSQLVAYYSSDKMLNVHECQKQQMLIIQQLVNEFIGPAFDEFHRDNFVSIQDYKIVCQYLVESIRYMMGSKALNNLGYIDSPLSNIAGNLRRYEFENKKVTSKDLMERLGTCAKQKVFESLIEEFKRHSKNRLVAQVAVKEVASKSHTTYIQHMSLTAIKDEVPYENFDLTTMVNLLKKLRHHIKKGPSESRFLPQALQNEHIPDQRYKLSQELFINKDSAEIIITALNKLYKRGIKTTKGLTSFLNDNKVNKALKQSFKEHFTKCAALEYSANNISNNTNKINNNSN